METAPCFRQAVSPGLYTAKAATEILLCHLMRESWAVLLLQLTDMIALPHSATLPPRAKAPTEEGESTGL